MSHQAHQEQALSLAEETGDAEIVGVHQNRPVGDHRGVILWVAGISQS